jgi:glycopeptide antibiotics resistance protein
MLRSFRWALLWALCILVLCLIPGRSLPDWSWFDLLSLDKLVHAGMFGTLTVLIAGAFVQRQATGRFLLMAVGISAAYGVGTEFMQGLEALGRRTDLNDMIANSVGAIAGAWFCGVRIRKGKAFLPVFLR